MLSAFNNTPISTSADVKMSDAADGEKTDEKEEVDDQVGSEADDDNGEGEEEEDNNEDEDEDKDTEMVPAPSAAPMAELIGDVDDGENNDEEAVVEDATIEDDDDDDGDGDVEMGPAPKASTMIGDDRDAKEVALYGGGGRVDSDDDDPEDQKPLAAVLNIDLDLPDLKEEKDITFSVLSTRYRLRKPLMKSPQIDVAGLCALRSTDLKALKQKSSIPISRIEDLMSRLAVMSDGPWVQQRNIHDSKSAAASAVRFRSTDDHESDEDDDRTMVDAEDEKERYMSVDIPGLDVRTLRRVPFDKMHGPRDLSSFERYILPELAKMPEFVPLCWHYAELDKMRVHIGTQIREIEQAAFLRANAARPGEFDLELISQRVGYWGGAYVLHYGEGYIFKAVDKFMDAITRIWTSFLRRKDPKDIYETQHDQNMLREVTSIKWLCLLKIYVQYDLLEGCVHNINLCKFLAKVTDPSSSLDLDPRVKFDGKETLKALILRASKRAAQNAGSDTLRALSDLFEEKLSDANSVINQVPLVEMKDKSVLCVLVHMHPSVRDAAVHPCAELPDEHTNSVCVSIRLQTLNAIYAQMTDRKSSEWVQCESYLTSLEKRFRHLNVDWKSVTKERLTACITMLEQMETTVNRLMRFVGEGLARSRDERKAIRAHVKAIRPMLANPDVSVLNTGRPNTTSSFVDLFGKGLEPFYTRLKAVEAANEQKDIADTTALYSRTEDCVEGAVAEKPELSKWYQRAMQDFVNLRKTRAALWPPSRFALHDESEYEKVVQTASRNERHAKRKADRDAREKTAEDDGGSRKKPKTAASN